MTEKKSVIQFSFDKFDVSIAPYCNGLLVIINSGIQGVGTIIRTDEFKEHVETDLLVGKQDNMLELLAMQLTLKLKAQSIVFVMSFKPEILDGFEGVRKFLDGFVSALQK